MHAELRTIELNDRLSWDEWVTTRHRTPGNDYEWFTITIGPAGELGSDLFQVVVSTPSAASSARGKGRKFKGILVESIEPELIRQTLIKTVSEVERETWPQIVERLSEVMHWEYEGMAANQAPGKRR